MDTNAVTEKRVSFWLEQFLKKVKTKWAPEKVILFGSRVKGNRLVFSDLDLLIVSEKFKDLNSRERKELLLSDWDGLIDLELICLLPEEFEKKKSEIGIVQEIIKTGIEFVI